MKQERFDEIVTETQFLIGQFTYNELERGICGVKDIFGEEAPIVNILRLLQIERELTMPTISTHQIMAERLAYIQNVLLSKGKEYGSVDRLHNFRRAARISGGDMVSCAKMFQLKHLISIEDLLTSKLEATREMINEKVGDAINYEVLMRAIQMEVEDGTDS